MARSWIRTNDTGITSPKEICCTNLIQDSKIPALPIELSSPYRWHTIANLPYARATHLISPLRDVAQCHNCAKQPWVNSNHRITESKSVALNHLATGLDCQIYVRSYRKHTPQPHTCILCSGNRSFRWRISLPLPTRHRHFSHCHTQLSVLEFMPPRICTSDETPLENSRIRRYGYLFHHGTTVLKYK